MTTFTKILNYIKSLCTFFFCQIVLIFPIYTLFTKTIKTFWSKDITSIWGHFEPKIHNDFWSMSSLHVLNCPHIPNIYIYIYILFTKIINIFWSGGIRTLWALKIKQVKFIKIFLTTSSPCVSNIVYYWCTLKALLSKNWFYFFFLIFWQFHHFLGCHGISINSLLIFFKCCCIFQSYHTKLKVGHEQ